jgi:hypothetical protein
MTISEQKTNYEISGIFWRCCVKYIEENEDWLTTNRLERSYQQEERKKMWEKEERLERMANKIGPKKEMIGKNRGVGESPGV